MTIEHTIGTRAQVWHGTAKKTSGGLTKNHLMMNKHGRIVSRKKHASGKRSIKHLEKLGYKAKKGQFTLFRKGRKGSRKMRGGTGAPMGSGMPKPMTMGNHNASHATPSHHMMKKGGRSRKMRGGMAYGGPLSPLAYNGQGQGTSGVNLQFIAGNAA
jgi:hypothetical protein